MTQQPLTNFEIHDLCFEIAGILQKNEDSEKAIQEVIEKAITAKIIEDRLNKFILLPKYKVND